MENLDDSKIIKILDAVIIILLFIIIGILIKDVFFDEICECESTDNLVSIVDTNLEENADTDDEKVIDSKNYMIDIKGAVKNPGVYQVSENSIINDAIKLAGGLKSNASTKYINLSKKVSDEMVLVIYTNSEVTKMSNSINQVCESSGVDIAKCEGSSVIVSSNSGSSNSSANSDKDSGSSSINENNKVSINSGTKEQLMTLSGVGEAKALAIIEYRTNNNGFKTLEELMNVSGIGESAYNKIKDNITL